MKIINDSRSKTYFIQRKTAAINTYIAGPTNGAHRATRLTIQSGKTRLDLNGRQIRTLREVLDKSKSFAGVRTRVTRRNAAKPVKTTKPVKPSKPVKK
jgi:hypothetical protein